MGIPPRPTPRISVNDLALFMVSSDTARLGIIRRAREPQVPPIIRYRDARAPICAFLTDDARSGNHLLAAEAMFEQRSTDAAESSLRRDDALRSIEVLRAVQRMSNQLAVYTFGPAPHEQPRLHISGVEVSVRADLLVFGRRRGGDQIGAAILRMTQSEAANEQARARRREMGHVVATLARFHVERLAGEREPTNRLCMAIDVQHGEVFPAPNANTQRMRNIESACQTIAALWDVP